MSANVNPVISNTFIIIPAKTDTARCAREWMSVSGLTGNRRMYWMFHSIPANRTRPGSIAENRCSVLTPIVHEIICTFAFFSFSLVLENRSMFFIPIYGNGKITEKPNFEASIAEEATQQFP